MFTNTPAFSSYSVDNLAEAMQFYGETLGLNIAETKEGLQITHADGHEAFLYPKQDHVPATFTVLNFKVDGIDEAVEALNTKGVGIERYDTEMISTDEKGIFRGKEDGNGPDIAWFKDPAGNILSVVEE